MPASKSNGDLTFGFLRVTDLGGGTLIGGYLVLNSLGRPLEFHCTEPLKPNRAQQILFGATLESYLYGEQIAQSLVNHCSLKPGLLITDQRPVLSVRTFVEIPVIWIPSDGPDHAREGAKTPDGCQSLQLGTHTVWLDEGHQADCAVILQCYQSALPGWDLAEPFERIHQAMTELQKAA